jgi:phage gp46-like protein
MASSSALGLGDLALTWSIASGDSDLSIVDSDLASDRGLETAMILSLFTDRRADDDDVPPSGDPTDRRGWWADELGQIAGDKLGSRLWLLDRSKRTSDTLLRAKGYVVEALEWMIADQVASVIDVETSFVSGVLVIDVGVQRPGRDRIAFRFSSTWDNLQGVG